MKTLDICLINESFKFQKPFYVLLSSIGAETKAGLALFMGLDNKVRTIVVLIQNLKGHLIALF